MSLIQEALRRKDDENLGLPPKIIPLIAPTIRKWPVKQPENFDQPLARAVKTSRKWVILLISLLVFTFSMVAVGLLLYSGRLHLRRGQQAKTVHVAIAPQAEVRVIPVSPPVSPPVLPPVPLQSSWPKLKVVGVMARTDVQDVAAIIDGNLVECGDEIRGVKVQGVDKSGVWFVFKSQTQFVRVGQTTL
jgi:hypothetical protein